MPAPEIENLRTIDGANFIAWRADPVAPGDVDVHLIPGNGSGTFGAIQAGAGISMGAGGKPITAGLWYGASGPVFDAPIVLDPANPQQVLIFNMTGGFNYDTQDLENGFRLYLASGPDWADYAWVSLGGRDSPWYLAGKSAISTHAVRGAMDFATPGFDPGAIVRLGNAMRARVTSPRMYNFRMGLGPVSYLNGPIRLVGGTAADPHSFARMHALLRDPTRPYAAWISESSAAGIGLRAGVTIATDHFDAPVAGFGFEPGFDDARGRVATPAGTYALGWDLPAGASSRWAAGLFAAPIPTPLSANGAGNTIRAVPFAGLGVVAMDDATWQDVIFSDGASFAVGTGQCDTCTFPAPVTITAASGLVDGRIVATTGAALTIAGGPGDYSGITPRINSPLATCDLVVGAGGAGPYDLSGLTVPEGYTLRVHNPTADAITVALGAGIPAIPSGGAITIDQPRPTQSVAVANGIPGTLLLIQDLTAAQILYLGRPDTWPHVWTDPAPYAADREIRIRAMYAVGTKATLFIDQIAGSVTEAAPALPFRLNQQIDAVHGANGIDGAAVTGVVFDDAAGLIRTSRSALSLPELYAAEAAIRATEAGITGTGRLLSAPDPANYLLAGARLRNEGAAALTLSGGYLRGATGRAIDAIDGAGGTVLMAPDHVVAYAADGSGAADPAALAGALRAALAVELARINALPGDVPSQATLLAAIEEAALL